MPQLTLQQIYNLAVQHHRAGKLKEAEELYRQMLQRVPEQPDALHKLGLIALQTGHEEMAEDLIRRSLAKHTDDPEALSNLGAVLRKMNRHDEAIACFRRAIELQPRLPVAHFNLANAFHDQANGDEAIAAYRRAIALQSNYFEAHHYLGNELRDQGQILDAIAEYRLASSLAPNNTELPSKLVFTLNFHPQYDARMVAGELAGWERRYAHGLRQSKKPHGNDRNPDRPLKIGYVSPDFRDHCQSFFTIPLLSRHDHQEFQIVCYGDEEKSDDVTQRIQGYADVWRRTFGTTDEQVANQIRQDQIDILVDLTMHMPHHRLLVFARKPAPVQVTWLAYPSSTGLRTIDYRLSDPHLDPPGGDESVYTERTIRLPGTFWCYDPLEGRDLAVNASPAQKAGFVTFGCQNNFWKVNESNVDLWAQVLGQVPGSRFMMLAPLGSPRQRVLDRFGQHGIDSARIEFVAIQPRQTYLERYHQIDIGLDCFPYNGHTTSLDSMWMGVPVVSLVGRWAVSRAGWCQLSNLGLSELAAQRPEDFVKIAVELARDLPRLEQLRSTLRQRMLQSPLMDAPRFAANVESAYRRMWKQWCEEQADG